jgi:hypothetical protein
MFVQEEQKKIKTAINFLHAIVPGSFFNCSQCSILLFCTSATLVIFFVSRKLRHWVLCCFLFLFARMDTLQRHMPAAGQDGVEELLKIAWRFEEKIFQAATDQVNSLSLSVGKH